MTHHAPCTKKDTWVSLLIPSSFTCHTYDLIGSCRETIQLIDLICGTLCHGPSMNSFKYPFQTKTSTNWKYCNRLAHQRHWVRPVSFEWTRSTTRCRLFSLDLRSCVRRTLKNCISSLVTEAWLSNYHHYAIWMWSGVSMYYIVVRRFRWTFNRHSLYFVDGTSQTLQETGLRYVLFAPYLTYGHCVWLCATCICLRVIRVVTSLPRQWCRSSISPSLFGGADPSVTLMTKQHSNDVVHLLNSFGKRLLHYQVTRYPSVWWKKMVVDWWSGVNDGIKKRRRLPNLLENDRFILLLLMFNKWCSSLE